MNFEPAFAQSRERDFHYVLGFRARDQHRRRHFEFQSPEFLPAGEVLRRLARRAPRDQSEELFRLGGIEGLLYVGVHPSPVAAQRVHQQQFGRERMRRSVCGAQTGHAVLQRASNVYLICHGV